MTQKYTVAQVQEMTMEQKPALDIQANIEAAAQLLVTLETANEAGWNLANLTFESTRGAGKPAAGDPRLTLQEWAKRVEQQTGTVVVEKNDNGKIKIGEVKFGERTARRYRKVWEEYSSQRDELKWWDAYSQTRDSETKEPIKFPTKTDDPNLVEEDPDTENYGKKAVIHAGGQVTTYPAPDEDENSYTVISAKERQEIAQDNPELAAILDRDDLSDVHVKIMDFVHRIKDATERGERGWEEIENKGIEEANFTGLEQQMMNYALEVFRDCQERQRKLVTKMEQTIGSSQSDANRFMKKVK